jgi:uncharacterized membrane protein YqiK
MQKQMVEAQQSVEIAQRTADAAVKKSEGEATSVKLRNEAEAQAMQVRARAEAESLRMRASAESEAVKLRAEAEAMRIAIEGKAEAEKILAIGQSTAEAFQLAVKAMGDDNFTRLKVAEEIGKNNIKVIPDVLITGGNGGADSPISGILGLKLMEMLQKDAGKDTAKNA